MATAFQPNAFQNNAFQVTDSSGSSAAPTESIKVNDGGLVGRVEIIGLGNPIKITDTVFAELSGLATAKTESFKVSDVVSAQLFPLFQLEANLSEGLKVVDTLSVLTTDRTVALTTEDARVDDGGRVDLLGVGNPIKITESISVLLVVGGGTFTVSKTETVKVADSVSAFLVSLAAIKSESLKITDSVSANLGLIAASLTESFRIADSGEVELVRDETIRITDALQAILFFGDLPGVASESVKISDTVSASLAARTVSKTETVRVLDVVLAVLTAFTISKSESAKISDALFVSLGAIATVRVDQVKVADSVFAELISTAPEPPIGGDSGSVVSNISMTIGGTPVTYHLGTLNIHQQTNARNTLDVEIISLDTTFRPAWNDEIIIMRGLTPMFGGYVEDFQETGVGGESASPHAQYNITAVDYNSLPDRRYVNGILPAGTLKSQLQLLEPFLTPNGVTLSPLQADGPVLPAMPMPFMLLTDILNRICEIAVPFMAQAVVWEINYSKLLRVFGVLDGSHNAPFDITASNAATYVVDDVRVKPTKTDYANGILLVYGEGRHEQVDTLGVADGVTSAFAFHLPPTVMHGYINVGGSIVSGAISGGTNESLGLASESPTWVYDPGTNIATRTSPPGVGQNILCPYEAQYPGMATAYATGVPFGGLVERLYTQPDIFDVVQAQAVADSLLIKANIELQELEYETHTDGLFPGQVQTVTLPKRNVSGVHVITSVDVADIKETVFTYRVRGVSGSDALPESWLQTYQVWSRGSTAGGSAAVTVFTGSPMRPSYFLGGNETLYRQDPTPTWVAVDAVRVTIDTNLRQSASGIVYCRLRATAGTVQARLRKVSGTPATVGTSAVVASTSWTDADFSVTLEIGAHVYELQILPSLADVDVAGVGTFL
jgi:hypothetical protein